MVAPEEFIEQVWIRHDYVTTTPGFFGERLAAIAMEPKRIKAIMARTRKIIQTNLPIMNEWFDEYSHLFNYVPPVAGAVAYFEYDLPISSIDLFTKIREECSVLVAPGDQFGLEKGIRVGFGYDIQKTMKGLALMEELIKKMTL